MRRCGQEQGRPQPFLTFNGSGYYLKSAEEMRRLFPELPEACDNTLLVAEMVGDYSDVFAYVRPDAAVPGHARRRDAGVLAAQGGRAWPGDALAAAPCPSR
ncbi:hypothetical protein GCM10020219_101530 [Nonomuraea dietziae]